VGRVSIITFDPTRPVASQTFTSTPYIRATLSKLPGGRRPALVVGFAAETDDVVENATAKRVRKGCDWIVANDVSPGTGIMGGTENAVTLVSADGAEAWPRAPKAEVARRLAARVAEALQAHGSPGVRITPRRARGAS
ncbi:MAG: phosphopantothenoylcysteine decarboxylase, partial [Pseudomonadota bacterium]